MSGRPQKTKTEKTGGSVYVDLDYEYDKPSAAGTDGELISKRFDRTATPNQTVTVFDRDSYDRLEQAKTTPVAGGPPTARYDYTYDPNGNMLSAIALGAPTGTYYGYDPQNRLCVTANPQRRPVRQVRSRSPTTPTATS